MGEFYAWAATGHVAGFESWVVPEGAAGTPENAGVVSGVQIASRMVERQHFTLRQHDGGDVAVDLTDTGVGMRDGHAVTLVWAAREGTAHGHCVYLENHTTGVATRLLGNVELIRSTAGSGRLTLFGLAATVPAAIAMLGWLLTPGALQSVDPGVFFAGVVLAVVVLFFVGALVSKLMLDFQRSEDDARIWRAVNLALSGKGAGGRADPRARW